MGERQQPGNEWLPDGPTRQQLTRYSIAELLRVDSLVRAHNRSTQRDAGPEFERYRSYQPGDDLRRVDWRAYGRTDRLLIREAEREGRLTLAFVIDLSASMGMTDAVDMSRFDYAARLVAALGWLAVEQRHDVTLIGLSQEGPVVVSPAQGRAQLERVLRALAQSRPGGAWPETHNVHQSLQALPPRSAVVFIGDLLAQDDEMEAGLAQLVSGQHALHAVQVLLPQEVDLPSSGQVRVRDIERGGTRLFDTRAFRKTYQSRMSDVLDRTRRQQARRGARFVRTATDVPLQQTLRALLNPTLRGRDRLLASVVHR